MYEKIPVSTIWEQTERTIIDVRTPAEFQQAHIPNAINIPLFSNEERVKVGTLYKKVSPDSAFLHGLDFVGPKMSSFIKKARKFSIHNKVIVHCWRGGKRSGSMSWLLRFAGLEVTMIEGGYKAYRNHILGEFERKKLNIVILGGKTGTGKTQVLQALAQAGEQVIDLEALAHHKGSAFGAIGEIPQPTSEQFENNLYEIFKNIDPTRRVWVEDESLMIGTVSIPLPFWQQMYPAKLYIIELPIEVRLDILVEVYATYPKQDLINAFLNITQKLGGQHVKTAVQAIENNDFHAAAAIALAYYDKAYQYSTDKKARPNVQKIPIFEHHPANTAKILMNL
jgi:tRNA 2-selenouridine synthase